MTIKNVKIRDEVLKIAEKREFFAVSDVLSEMKKKYSRQYLFTILGQLVSEGVLVKKGKTRYTLYALKSKLHEIGVVFNKTYKNIDLQEHIVLEELNSQFPALSVFPEHIRSIFAYAFSEMLNNAIDHSQSKKVDVSLKQFPDRLVCSINDHGIGVFKNIMMKKKLKDELEAIRELLKGKLTTMPKLHSGEGIFFTSKVCDVFILNSFNYQLKVDNEINDIFILTQKKSNRGTQVIFEIKNDHKGHLNDVFEKYYSDPKNLAFDKTDVHIKLYTMGTIYVSRSQAKRVLSRLDEFKTVVLDFDKVPTVGQAFADEIFRVFKKSHPKITITPINMNKAVKFMVDRVG